MKQTFDIPVLLEYEGGFNIYKKSFLDNDEMNKQLSYWENKLKGFESLDLRTDYVRANKTDSYGKKFHFELNNEMTLKLRLLAKEQGVTLYTLLLSVFNILLSKYSNQEDIIVGSSSANRYYKQIESLSGFFVNTLAIRTKVNSNKKFKDFLNDIDQNVVEAHSHQDIPFSSIVENLKINKDQSTHPIFQVLFSFQNFGDKKLDKEFLDICDMDACKLATKYDLFLSFSDERSNIKGVINYTSALFKETSIKKMADRYKKILEQITTNPNVAIKDINLLSKEEYTELIYTNNQTQNKYSQITIHEVFERRVKETPNNIALQFEEKELTYKELDELSNQMARYINSKYKEQTNSSLKADTLIALCLDRSLEMIISILGVLKAGGAYVPVDPNYPDDRIKYILEDTDTNIILSQSHLEDKISKLVLNNASLLLVDKDEYKKEDNSLLASISKTKDLAYVIYTSGTTGKPKGVMIEHKGVINLVENQINSFNITQRDTVLQFASYSFDAAVWEIYSSLLIGGKLLMLNSVQREQNFTKFIESCKDESIVTLLPPTLLESLEYKKLKNLKTLVTGGDKCSKEAMDKWSEDRDFINAYGPTESTVAATIHYHTKESLNTNIGKALPNTKLYILDNNLQPVPKGITGELYIAGAGLARGYLNKEELTKERFINNPFASKSDIANGYTRMYKTGDLVRLLEDNNIEYIGRSDFQVKIRGYRIELGEIENVISKYEGIKQSVVLAKENNNSKYLVAYYTSSNEINEESLIQTISKELAEYMIPTAFVQVDEFKLTVNGKLDTRALPEPELKGEEYVAPSDELEIKICNIFQEVLNVKQVGIKDDFFKLGGNSILAISLAHKLSKALSLEIKVADIFTYKNISQLIEHGLVHDTIHIPIIKQDKYPLSFSQRRLYFIEKYEGGSNVYNIPISIKLNKGTNLKICKEAIKAIVNRHDILRTLIKEDTESNVYQELSKEELYFNEFIYSNKEELNTQIKEDINRIFRLNKELPIYVGIYELKEEVYILINIHLIACDGWSTDIFFKELNEYYYHYKDSTPLDLPKLTIRYKDFASWQKDYLQEEALDSQLSYWENKLQNLESLSLLSDYPRAKKMDYEGDKCQIKVDKRLSNDLILLAKNKGVTMYTLLLSAFNILLSKYSNQEDIVIGSLSANRHYKQIENMIGYFVNTLPIRNTISKAESFNDFLEKVEQSVIETQSNQDIPFEYLVNKLNIQRDQSRHPIFDILFSFQNFVIEDNNSLFSKYNIDSYNKVKFDLELFISQDETDCLDIYFSYRTSLFKRNTIKTMMQIYLQILSQISLNPKMEIKDISLLTQGEDIELIHNINDTKDKDILDSIEPLPDLFERQVSIDPDAIAVIDSSGSYTYQYISEYSNYLASFLKDVKANGIAIYTQKGYLQPLAAMAVLKADKFFLPFGDWPSARMQNVLDDSKIDTILVSSLYENFLEELKDKYNILVIEELLDSSFKKKITLPKVSQKSLAYIIYTSGSTGKPKGVMASHEGVANTVLAVNRRLNVNSDDCAFGISEFSFDLSAYDIFGMLSAGGSILYPDSSKGKDPSHWCELISKYKPSIWNSVPQLVEILYDEAYSNNQTLDLKNVLMSGDYIPLSLPSIIKKDSINTMSMSLGGATEGSIWSIWYEIKNNDPSWGTIPYGIPLPNQGIYVLSNSFEPLPIGALGDLYITGLSVSPGYYNNQQKTDESFFNHPSLGYIYKTGDLGVLSSKGYYEFKGRSDFQVKINGYRIELAEIESVINKYEGIKQSVVLSKSINNTKYLVAYYTSQKNIEEQGLVSYISKELADYMIPNFFVNVDRFTLSVNGKLDTKALPEVELKSKSYIAPSSEIEIKICNIFKEVLNIEQVGIKDDFFKLGGNSILAISLANKLSKALDLEIKLIDIFTMKTAQQIIQYKNLSLNSIYNDTDNRFFSDVNKIDYIKMAIEDSEPLDIKKDIPTKKAYSSPKIALLTGASGFLGIYLLVDLLKKVDQVYCLVRCIDEQDGIKKILEQAKKANLDINLSQVKVIKGDLSVPNLGLSNEIRKELAKNVDTIVHCGAYVHHLHNYKTLKNINIDSLRSLLELTIEYKIKSFTFISTIGMPLIVKELKNIPERIVDEIPSEDNGYLLSKWVGEKLVANFSKRYGIDTVIIRPGNITGSSDTGFSDFKENHFWLFNKGCIQLGFYPKMEKEIEMMPVDILSNAITALALASGEGLSIRNLDSLYKIDLDTFFSYFKNAGFNVELQSLKEWQEHLKNIGVENGLAKIKDFYTDKSFSYSSYKTDKRETIKELKSLGVSLEVDYGVILPLYINYLREIGFLPAPK